MAIHHPKTHRVRNLANVSEDDIEEGQSLFRISKLKDANKRDKYAKEYVVSRIEGGVVYVVRKEKAQYKQYEMPVKDFSLMRVSTGYRNIELEEDSYATEDGEY